MNENASRRQFLQALALGGAVIAGEIWIPGQRLISIPRPAWPWTANPAMLLADFYQTFEEFQNAWEIVDGSPVITFPEGGGGVLRVDGPFEARMRALVPIS